MGAVVAEKAFRHLKAPIKRVCAPDIPVLFSPVLEKYWMPNEKKLVEAVKAVM